MIKDHWFCIAGIHACDDGRIAAVWLGHDKPRDTVHVFDAIVLRRSVPVVIAERLNAGSRRWVPVAWPKHAEKLADKLLSTGCNVEPEPCDDSEAAMDVMSRTVREWMESERFKVSPDCEVWTDEYKGFHVQDTVPGDSYPLMAATWHAMAKLDYARKKPKQGGASVNYPEVQVI